MNSLLSCKHPKLACRWQVKTEQRDAALVSCKSCGFSIEIIASNCDEALTEASIITEFNAAADRYRRGKVIIALN